MTAATTALVALALALGGCGHSYIYSGSAPPPFEGQDLVVVEPAGASERYPVTQIVVEPRRGGMRTPTQEEIDAWRIGDPTPEIETLRVDVSTTGAIWGDWAVGGFGIGVTFGMVLFSATGLIGPTGNDTEIDLPFALVLSLVLGVEGGLIGALVGAISEQGSTDMRLHSYKGDHDVPRFSPPSPP